MQGLLESNDMQEFANYIKAFVGMDVNQLKTRLHIESKSKSLNFIISSAICNSFGGKEYFKLLLKRYGFAIKTIQLKENGKPQEAMSFAPIDYMGLSAETWETSEIRNMLSHPYLFFVFKKSGTVNTLLKVIWWSMPSDDLEGETKRVWADVQTKLNSGNLIKSISDKGEVQTTFPREAETIVCHVRTHGKNGSDLAKVPVPDQLTGYVFLSKQSFWLNHGYLLDIVTSSKSL